MLLVSVYPIILFHLIVVSLSSVCVFISLCVAFVLLALDFLPGLYSAAYRAVLLFVFLFLADLFLFFVSSASLLGDDVLCWLPFCPLSSVCFPCFSPKLFPV